MTPTELKSSRQQLGLSAQQFAEAFGVSDGRTVRGWEAGERNGKPTNVPESIAILVRMAIKSRSVRKELGIDK